MRKLNNMDKAQVLKKKCDDWTNLYHKTLKRLEAIIDMQKQVKKMIKIAIKVNTTIIKMEGIILKASINNQIMNTTNILRISEDLQNLIQYDIENRVYQIQRMLADELDAYKGRENLYMNNNIQEIQELYKEEEQRKEERTIKDKEFILVKPY